MTTTLHITPDIIDFARRVREHLADLPSEEVDDLTDGLEADMAEAFAENHELPDPAAYAVELRNAAGLPVRAEVTKSGIRQAFRGLGSDLRLKREQFAAELRKSPVMAGVLDFLVELRPVWWVLRAWIAYQLAGALFGFQGPVLPSDIARWLLLIVFVLVSVQWGRGSWLPLGKMSTVIVAGNVLAALWLIPALSQVYAWSSPWDYASSAGYSEPPVLDGTAIDSEQVSNIFAYDAAGNPLTNVQLFDATGRPLVVGAGVPGPECDVECSTEFVKVPSILENGLTAWNVFPLQQLPESETKFDDTTGRYLPGQGAKLEDAVAPFVKVPALEKSEKAAEKVEKGNG